MLGDDGTVLAELDMKLTQEQFFTLYEQPSNLMYVYTRVFKQHSFFIIMTPSPRELNKTCIERHNLGMPPLYSTEHRHISFISIVRLVLETLDVNFAGILHVPVLACGDISIVSPLMWFKPSTASPRPPFLEPYILCNVFKNVTSKICNTYLNKRNEKCF